MSDTAMRLLSLLYPLQGERDWTGGELAERLGVSGRTARADVDRLPRPTWRHEASVTLPAPVAEVDLLSAEGARSSRWTSTAAGPASAGQVWGAAAPGLEALAVPDSRTRRVRADDC